MISYIESEHNIIQSNPVGVIIVLNVLFSFSFFSFVKLYFQ